MKVLFLIDTLDGYGAEKSLVQIAMNLTEVTPIFVHLFKGDKLKASLEDKGIKVYSLNLTSSYTSKEAIKHFLPILNKEQPDILHSTLFRADMLARKIKGKYPELLLVGSFVSNSYGLQRYKQLSLLSRLKLFSTQVRDKITANKVDFFICNSEAIKKTNIKALGVPKERVKIIYRGRSFKNYVSSPKLAAAFKKEFNLKNQKIFLNVGRLHKGKGQIDLLYAFKKMHSGYPDTVLFIVGEGIYRNELNSTIKRLGLEQDVFLLGYRDDVSELLEIADYFVFPTYFEGLPGALIEAIIAKRFSIVSNIEENKECLPQEAALFFEPGNIEDLSAKMEEALFLHNLEQKSEIAYQYAKDNFDIENISKKYEAFYKKIIRST